MARNDDDYDGVQYDTFNDRSAGAIEDERIRREAAEAEQRQARKDRA
jgi:hypothetical protein